MSTKGIRFTEGLNFIPVLVPQDLVATAAASAYVDLNLSNWVTFFVQTGAMTSDSTDGMVITVEASTAGTSNATEAAIPFRFRRAILNTDAWGAITTASSAGATCSATDDNNTWCIDIDPADLPTDPGADFRYVRVVLTPEAGTNSMLVAVNAVIEPKYPQNINLSSS